MKIWRKFVMTLALLLLLSGSLSLPEVKAGKALASPCDQTPLFRAAVEYSSQGYVVRGSLSELSADVSLVRILYSLDGENFLIGNDNWNISRPDSDEKLQTMLNQICFYGGQEPFRSYLAGEVDTFYLKLLLIRENGTDSETQTAVIDRGGVQPVSEDSAIYARFASKVRISTRPFGSRGQYQITVRQDAAPEELQTVLPDTLPIEIQIHPAEGMEQAAIGIVDCPVTWKPLTLSALAAGDSVTLVDAVEDIVIPGDTVVSTPLGNFRLEEPLDLIEDKVSLMLNVIAQDGEPAGALRSNRDGLEMAFDLKPTGATAIRAYAFTKSRKDQIPLSDVSLLDAVNAQPSAPNSGYTTVLENTAEPYRSYLEAEAAGDTPVPFCVVLEIEGGVYDGRQLILPWPDTYEPPREIPDSDGSGGNEGNAGADNKDDSTAEGQRPNLPRDPDDSDDSKDTEDTENTESTGEEQLPQPAHSQEDTDNRESVYQEDNGEAEQRKAERMEEEQQEVDIPAFLSDFSIAPVSFDHKKESGPDKESSTYRFLVSALAMTAVGICIATAGRAMAKRKGRGEEQHFTT